MPSRLTEEVEFPALTLESQKRLDTLEHMLDTVGTHRQQPDSNVERPEPRIYIQCSNGSSWPGAPIDMRRDDALLVHRPDTKYLPYANSDTNYRNSV